MPNEPTHLLLHQAITHHQKNRLNDAENLYRAILDQNPNHAAAIQYLGVIAFQRSQFNEAQNLLQKAIAIDPNLPNSHAQLTAILAAQNKWEACATSARRAIAASPAQPNLHNDLGFALRKCGKLSDAIVAFQQAIKINPDFHPAIINLGNSYLACDRLLESLDCFNRAMKFQPRSAMLHANLSGTCKRLGKLDDAALSAKTALSIDPNHLDALNNLAAALSDMGLASESKHYNQKALELNPNLPSTHSNLLMTLNYVEQDPQLLDQAARKWGEQHRLPHVEYKKRSPDKKFRIGYVSADLCGHVCANFILPLLAHHDRSRFEIAIYSCSNKSDETTEQIRALADHFVEVASLADEQFARQIVEDEIDILIDLMLHTAGNRLPVFTTKPAPLQLTYLGYPGTTGVAEIDYRITDPHLESRQSFGIERPALLPATYWCYRAHPYKVNVEDPPILKNGYITFGSTNRFAKVSDYSISLWARILKDVPNSRLMIHAPEGSCRMRVMDVMKREGIDSNRIRFVGRTSLEEYLKGYNQIDVLLDTYPCAGGATSCDALWMSTPIITQAGSSPISRGGVSLLNNINCPELIATSADDYIEIAKALANDPGRIAMYKSTIRERFIHSPVMDEKRFAKEFEAMLMAAWREKYAEKQG